ncbi:MAG: hypothetical protein P4L84_26025 [Isosphaeraceae bacterium]|nr:hypothetical protein [Isosphaeraceae bacterium]
MTGSTILVVGTGRCGLLSMVHLLNRQPDTRVSHQEPPRLPWVQPPGRQLMRERFLRMRKQRNSPRVGDAAHFYLPYLEEAIAAEPNLRVIGLKRPCEEVIASFCRWADSVFPLPTVPWARVPAPNWHHDPIWTPTFPQYDTQDRAQAIRLYWQDYYEALERLAQRHPEHIRVFNVGDALDTEAGQREVLTFAGFSPERQHTVVGLRATPARPPLERPQARRTSNHPLDPGRCAVLVPFTGSIFPQCERALQELERRGYHVRRVGGYAAIDQGRNQMSTDALIDGFEETMWIDADVDFHPDAVDQLRACGMPIVCGIYPQKGKRALACHIMPGTPSLVFGRGGGPVEILYAGTGFLLVRREVYLTMQKQLPLPVTNERFGAPMIPFFQPALHPIEDGSWYLAEDFAFCQRARTCGFRIMADTSIRLWHIGTYPYSWEDAGIDRERTGSFTLHFPEKAPDEVLPPSLQWGAEPSSATSQNDPPGTEARTPQGKL